MRLLCTGANGMLGIGIRRAFHEDDVIYTDKPTLDVSDYDSVMDWIPRMDGVECILHLAAETDLEWCDRNPAQAYHTNTIGTVNMTRLAQLLKIPIVYISTAGVFLGDKKAYDESSKPEPLNVYGRSKWYGELAVRTYPKYYIFRMSWAFGGGPELDKKFVNKIVKLIREGKEEIHAISDVFGSPTYTLDVARTIRECLVQRVPFGVYHTAGVGKASRYDVAEVIVNALRPAITLVPVPASAFHDKFPCPRARNEVLITNKVYPSQMRDWREALNEYLKEYFLCSGS